MRSSDNCRRGKSPTWHALLEGWMQETRDIGLEGYSRDETGMVHDAAPITCVLERACVRGLPS